MGQVSNIRSESRPDIVCLEGNGCRPSHFGDGWRESETMYTLNTTEVHAICYGICSYHSNAMLSDNPHSGVYVADISRTLDLNGGSPACNQGGICVLEINNFKADGAKGEGVAFAIVGDHENRPTDMTNLIVYEDGIHRHCDTEEVFQGSILE